MARLDGTQKALVERSSDCLVELERVLQRELNEVLNQQQELWALKSRMNWMVLGDRNTSFFFSRVHYCSKKEKSNFLPKE